MHKGLLVAYFAHLVSAYPTGSEETPICTSYTSKTQKSDIRMLSTGSFIFMHNGDYKPWDLAYGTRDGTSIRVTYGFKSNGTLSDDSSIRWQNGDTWIPSSVVGDYMVNPDDTWENVLIKIEEHTGELVVSTRLKWPWDSTRKLKIRNCNSLELDGITGRVVDTGIMWSNGVMWWKTDSDYTYDDTYDSMMS